ncbi:MAG TPA: RNA-binding protein [Parasegetibacter sp.]
MKLFVAGLPSDFDDVDMKEMFELYGEVSSARVIVDRATGKSKGFGFVEMPDRNEALLTMETLDGASLKGGKTISVKEAEEPGSRGPSQRGGGGGRGPSDFRRNNYPNRDNRDRDRGGHRGGGFNRR